MIQNIYYKLKKRNRNNVNLQTDTFGIYRYEIRSGADIQTESGLVNIKDLDLSKVENWRLIFSGKDVLTASWKNHIKGQNNDLEEPNDFILEYGIGWFKVGIIIDNVSSSVSIDKDKTYDTYLDLQASIDITLRFGGENNFIAYDLKTKIAKDELDLNVVDYDENIKKCLYKIPRLSNRYFIIKDITYYNEGNKKWTDISFTSLDDKLRNTGATLDQEVLSSYAIGAEKIIPQESFIKEIINEGIESAIPKYEEKIIVNFQNNLNVEKVKAVQVMLNGMCGYGDIVFYGSPVYAKDIITLQDDMGNIWIEKKRIHPIRHLFIYDNISLSPNKLEQSGTITDNLVMIMGSIATTNEKKYNLDFAEAAQANWISNFLDENSQGIFRIDTNSCDIPDKNISGVIPSIFNGNWNTTLKNTIYEKNSGINSSFYWDGSKLQQPNFANLNFYQYNFLHWGAYNNILRLPTSHFNTKYSEISTIPVIGKLANLIGLGNFTINTKTLNTTYNPISFLFDKQTLIDNDNYNLNPTPKEHELPLSVFSGKDDSNSPSGARGVSTIINGKLTHKIYVVSSSGTTNEFDTLELGRSVLLDDKAKYTPIAPITEDLENELLGYEIYGWELRNLYLGDYRITFFNNNVNNFYQNESIYSVKVKSNSQLSGSFRNWTTATLCNALDNEILSDYQNMDLEPIKIQNWKGNEQNLLSGDTLLGELIHGTNMSNAMYRTEIQTPNISDYWSFTEGSTKWHRNTKDDAAANTWMLNEWTAWKDTSRDIANVNKAPSTFTNNYGKQLNHNWDTKNIIQIRDYDNASESGELSITGYLEIDGIKVQNIESSIGFQSSFGQKIDRTEYKILNMSFNNQQFNPSTQNYFNGRMNTLTTNQLIFEGFDVDKSNNRIKNYQNKNIGMFSCVEANTSEGKINIQMFDKFGTYWQTEWSGTLYFGLAPVQISIDTSINNKNYLNIKIYRNNITKKVELSIDEDNNKWFNLTDTFALKLPIIIFDRGSSGYKGNNREVNYRFDFSSVRYGDMVSDRQWHFNYSELPNLSNILHHNLPSTLDGDKIYHWLNLYVGQSWKVVLTDIRWKLK